MFPSYSVPRCVNYKREERSPPAPHRPTFNKRMRMPLLTPFLMHRGWDAPPNSVPDAIYMCGARHPCTYSMKQSLKERTDPVYPNSVWKWALQNSTMLEVGIAAKIPHVVTTTYVVASTNLELLSPFYQKEFERKVNNTQTLLPPFSRPPLLPTKTNFPCPLYHLPFVYILK